MMNAQRVHLWDEINRYVVACGGDPSQHVYGNAPRQTAVAQVEKIVRDVEAAWSNDMRKVADECDSLRAKLAECERERDKWLDIVKDRQREWEDFLSMLNAADRPLTMLEQAKEIGRLTRENAALRNRIAKAEEVVSCARVLGTYDWESRLDDSKTSDEAKIDARELGIAVWHYDEMIKAHAANAAESPAPASDDAHDCDDEDCQRCAHLAPLRAAASRAAKAAPARDEGEVCRYCAASDCHTCHGTGFRGAGHGDEPEDGMTCHRCDGSGRCS